MINELLFLLQNLIIGSLALICTRFGISALTTFIALLTIFANLFVTKQIGLFGFTVTPTDAFMIGAVLGLNLMQEYYGKMAAFQALWIGFGAAALFSIVSFIHLQFIPSIIDGMQPHFYALLHNTPRIIIASLLAYAIGQTLEYRIYGWLKKRYAANHIIMRSNLSMIIAQLADTLIFSVAGLYGIAHNITHIIVVSYAMKLIAIGLTSPFVWLSKKIMPSGSGEKAHATV